MALPPLLELTPGRVSAALRRLHEAIWRREQTLEVEATAARAEPISWDLARGAPRKRVQPNTPWGRLYDQRWCRIALPAPQKSKTAYLEWRDQGEATLYVDGVPYYGFDVAHRHVALPKNARELWIECWCCQSAIWHPHATGLSPQGSVFEGAYWVSRDDAVWSAYHDLLCLADLMTHLREREPGAPREFARVGPQPSLDRATPLYRRLLRLLDQAIDALDQGGVAAMQPVLTRALTELRTSKAWVRAVLTGHAHIDLVWLWPERVGEAKAVHTFATATRLMELYPEFQFAYSQPASYAAVERLAPELSRRVAARIRDQRWQATGALYVESDTLLPCGEALARSFSVGQAEFARLRGEPSRLCWLPDVFGYSGCLPQLMRLAGVEWFFTTKLTWSALNRFPYSSFVWRGTDGSEVVAHVTQDSGYNNLVDLPRLHAGATGHVQADVHPEYLHPTGYGDGGGGPTEEMCERARRLSKLGDTPEIVWDQPEAFFERLARVRADLPVYQGECYLEYHRGTYTTHSELKASYRALERALQIREAVAVARGETPDLSATWKRLIFAQFHDYLPGSSVPEVYAQALPELRGLAQTQLEASNAALGTHGAAHQVFNPLPFARAGWFVQPGQREPIWIELPPLSSVPLAPSEKTKPPATTIKGRTLSNGRVVAEISEGGGLKRLRVADHETVFAGIGAVPVLYPDMPAAFEAWDIDQHSLRLGQPATSRATTRVEKSSAQEVSLIAERSIGKQSHLLLRYRLLAGEPVLRIEAEVDWREQQTLLKLVFPTAHRGAMARFGAPFGSVLRQAQSGSRVAAAQWEAPGSRWAAVANDGEREGLAVITEAKYGFSARDGELSVSLLRSAKIVGYDDHNRAAPRALSRLKLASPFSDQGRHVIRLALTRYSIDIPREEHPAALADSLFTPPILHRGEPASAGLRAFHGGESLIPAWAQPLDARSWLLRLHEVSGQRGYTNLELEPGWTAVRCGLEGTPLKGARPSPSIEFRPYEIVSVRVTCRDR